MERIDSAHAETLKIILSKQTANVKTGFTERGRIIPFYRRPYSIAASLILLIGIGWLIKIYTVQNDPKLLAANLLSNEQYAAPEPTVRGEGDTITYPWREYFVNGNFIRVINLILSKDTLDETEKFYLGYCSLKVTPKQLAQAEESLRQSISSPFYQSDAHYFLGITLVMENKFTEAKIELSQSAHPNARRIYDLLR
jgi:hypothetical protein